MPKPSDSPVFRTRHPSGISVRKQIQFCRFQPIPRIQALSLHPASPPYRNMKPGFCFRNSEHCFKSLFLKQCCNRWQWIRTSFKSLPGLLKRPQRFLVFPSGWKTGSPAHAGTEGKHLSPLPHGKYSIRIPSSVQDFPGLESDSPSRHVIVPAAAPTLQDLNYYW